jgi:hypothetical protein
MDLSKFNSQNHLYKITESTCSSLYKILTILEDNDILYTIDDSYEDSIILECKDYFKVFHNMKKFLDVFGKIKRIYRNRQYEELENTPFLDNNDFLIFNENNLKINPFNGSWIFEDQSGDFKTGILNYIQGNRSKYIDLSFGLKTILDIGLIDSRIIKDILNRNIKERKGLIEILFSRLKVKYTSENPESIFNDYLSSQNGNYSRCIPFHDKEKNEFGYWIWTKRYISNVGKNIFPEGELIMSDLETWEIPLENYYSSGNNCSIITFSGIDRVRVNYSPGKFLQLLDVSSLENSKSRIFLTLSYPEITPKNYEQLDVFLQKEVALIFKLLKDRGYITGNQQEDILYNLGKWKKIGIM